MPRVIRTVLRAPMAAGSENRALIYLCLLGRQRRLASSARASHVGAPGVLRRDHRPPVAQLVVLDAVPDGRV